MSNEDFIGILFRRFLLQKGEAHLDKEAPSPAVEEERRKIREHKEIVARDLAAHQKAYRERVMEPLPRLDSESDSNSESSSDSESGDDSD